VGEKTLKGGKTEFCQKWEQNKKKEKKDQGVFFAVWGEAESGPKGRKIVSGGGEEKGESLSIPSETKTGNILRGRAGVRTITSLPEGPPFGLCKTKVRGVAETG